MTYEEFIRWLENKYENKEINYSIHNQLLDGMIKYTQYCSDNNLSEIGINGLINYMNNFRIKKMCIFVDMKDIINDYMNKLVLELKEYDYDK